MGDIPLATVHAKLEAVVSRARRGTHQGALESLPACSGTGMQGERTGCWSDCGMEGRRCRGAAGEAMGEQSQAVAGGDERVVSRGSGRGVRREGGVEEDGTLCRENSAGGRDLDWDSPDRLRTNTIGALVSVVLAPRPKLRCQAQGSPS